MKYVLHYTAADDIAEKAPLHFADHCATWKKYQDAGTLLMIGPFSNPAEGALAIFTTRFAAEDFANNDPFVLHGVVKSWVVNEWREALT